MRKENETEPNSSTVSYTDMFASIDSRAEHSTDCKRTTQMEKSFFAKRIGIFWMHMSSDPTNGQF